MSNLKRYKCSFLLLVNVISYFCLNDVHAQQRNTINQDEKDRKNREKKIQTIRKYINNYRHSENIPKRIEMLSSLYKIYTSTTSIYVQQNTAYNLIFSNALILQVQNFNAYWLGAILKMILYHHPGLLFAFLFISKQIILSFVIFIVFIIGVLTDVNIFHFFTEILSIFGANISFLIPFEGIIFNIVMCKIFFCLAKFINIYTQKNRIDLYIGNYEKNILQFLIIILYIYKRDYIDNLISKINIVKLFFSYENNSWFIEGIMHLLQEFTMIVTIVVLLYIIKVLFDILISYIDENNKINYDKIFVYLELINVADLTKFGEIFLRCTIYASFFLIINTIIPMIFGNNTALLSIFVSVVLFIICEFILEKMIAIFLKSLLPNDKDTVSIPKKPDIFEAKPDASGKKTPEDIKKEKDSVEEYNNWRKKYYHFYISFSYLSFGWRKKEYLKIGDFFTTLQSIDTTIIKTDYNQDNVKFIENLYKLIKEDKYNEALKEMNKEIDKDGLCCGDDNLTEDEQSEVKDCFQFLVQEIANKSTGNKIDYHKLKNIIVNIIKDNEGKKSFVELLDAINDICEKKYSNILPPFYPANTGNYIHIVRQFMETQYIQTLNMEKIDVFIPSDVLQKMIFDNINKLKELEIIIIELENEFKQYHKDFQQIAFIIHQTLKDMLKILETDNLLIENRYHRSLLSRLFIGLETIELKGNEIRVASNGRIYKSRISPKRLLITSIVVVILSGIGFFIYNNLKEESIEDIVEDLWF